MLIAIQCVFLSELINNVKNYSKSKNTLSIRSTKFYHVTVHIYTWADLICKIHIWRKQISAPPSHLHSLLSYHNPARSLRSSNTNLLSVPRVHTTFASCGFSVAAPSVWNSLPVDIPACSVCHHIHSVVFLKPTSCFKQAFSSPQWLTQVPQIRPFGR